MRKRTLLRKESLGLTGVMAVTLSLNTMTPASYANTSTVPALGVAASSESRKSGTSLGMDTRQSADNNKAYYYHFDGLGSVVALSNSNGDSCQSYEYSAYGQLAASDSNFQSLHVHRPEIRYRNRSLLLPCPVL
ncbi:MAG TPA: hypothetical protein VMW72_20750 [Sedimentisphaerales bacterium]|nr:hypothetical protein [Sedimentisphaerales bacterium]